jgi:hypothetical protein
MYKTRIKQWDLHKNDQKKDKVARSAELRYQLENLNVDAPVLAKADLKRLARPVRQNGKRMALVDRDLRTKLRMIQKAHREKENPQVSCLLLQQSLELYQLESLLHHTQVYYSTYAHQGGFKPRYGYTPDLVRLFSSVSLANRLLETDVPRANSIFHAHPATLKVLVQKGPFQLLQHFVAAFANPLNPLSKSSPVRTKILQSAVVITGKHLAMSHPLTNALRLLGLSKLEDACDLSSSFMELHLNAARGLKDKYDRIRASIGVAHLMLELQQLDAAFRLCIDLWDDASPIHIPPYLVEIQLMETIAGVLSARGRPEDAVEMLWNIIYFNNEGHGEDEGITASYTAYHMLAKLYERIGELDKVSLCYWGSLQGILAKCYGPESFLPVLNGYQAFLTRHGRWQELAQLDAEYGHLWTTIDDLAPAIVSDWAFLKLSDDVQMSVQDQIDIVDRQVLPTAMDLG